MQETISMFNKGSKGLTRFHDDTKDKRRLFDLYKRHAVCVACHRDQQEVVLQFHHRVPAQKRFWISTGVTSPRISVQEFKRELDKCDLLCHACHIAKHAVTGEKIHV